MKEIRKKIIKIVSIVLAAAMIGTSSGLLAFAAQGGNDNNTSSSVSAGTSTQEPVVCSIPMLCALMTIPSSFSAPTR